jgi:integrative and conjugative element protein (TIGR02256 family)
MAIFASFPESYQRIVITPQVVDHLATHRQLSWYSREAGGQLFGSISASEVLVSVATGPYRGDQRWRSSYRSNAKAAQSAIDQHAGKGLVYLGEWHTHPEGYPTASAADRNAMTRLRTASETRSSALLMLIQGKADGVSGIALYSLGPNGLTQWAIVHNNTITADSGTLVSPPL